MTPFPILIYAAGKGTRMAHLTQDRPKPMIPVAGKPLIDHALDLTHDPAVTSTKVVNLHYMADQIRDHLTQQDITFSDESDGLLETGGGLRHAIVHLGGSTVMTLNADAVWAGPNPLRILQSAWCEEMEALLLTVPPTNAHGHLGAGDFIIGTDQRLSRGAGEIYTGAQIIRTDRLAAITQDAFSTNMVWDQMAADGSLFGVSYSGQWCDVGQPSSIPIAERMLKDHTNV